MTEDYVGTGMSYVSIACTITEKRKSTNPWNSCMFTCPRLWIVYLLRASWEPATPVLTPNSCTHRKLTHLVRKRMCFINGQVYVRPYNGGGAGSLQWSGFREIPTIILTFVAHWVRDIDFRMNKHSRDEMWLNEQTDTHTPTQLL